MFSIDVVASAPDDPSLQNVIYILICNAIAPGRADFEFADSRIALLCHTLRICVAHAPPELRPFPWLVY